MTNVHPRHRIDLTDDELDAATAILGRAIEPHACGPGTAWWHAFRAWEKCATARGTLGPEDDDA